MKKLEHIAYNKSEGKSPTVVFLSGFKSDMEGSKATFLEAACRELGQSFIRFDYSGHGKSGREFKDCTISDWLADALKVIDQLTTGKLILIGSSMGGWIILLAALARTARIKALIGIASAADFTEDLIWQKFSESERQQVLQNGFINIPNCYPGEQDYPITKKLIEDGRNHLIFSMTAHPALEAGSPHGIPHQVRDVLKICCPVTLLHGMQDKDVPYQTSLRLAEQLTSQNVKLHLIKNATHRMSEAEDLALLKAALIDRLQT